MMFLISQVAQAQVVKQDRDVSGISELSVSSAFKVVLKVGDEESLTLEVEERYMDDVVTEVRGGMLIIKMKEGNWGGRSYRMKESPKAYLTVKSLESIKASGAVGISSEGVLKGNSMDMDLSGASTINLNLEVNELHLEAAGACVVTLEGRATEQIVKTTGATTYRAFDLESEVADIRVTGAGSARVNVSDKLDVRASGASSVRYKGNPSVDSDTSGASSVRRSN